MTHYWIEMQQGPAICGLCNRCTNGACCRPADCDRRAWLSSTDQAGGGGARARRDSYPPPPVRKEDR